MHKNYFDYQKKLYQAIIQNDKIKLTQALTDDAKIHNDNKKNTINYYICTTLSNLSENFDLEILKILINHGAKISNSNKSNSLSIIIINLLKYIKMDKKKIYAEKIALELIQFLINHGALPNNTQTDQNTLTLAVKTENYEIVKLLCKCDIKPNNSKSNENTLYCSLRIDNPDMIFDIIKKGGKLYDYYNIYYLKDLYYDRFFVSDRSKLHKLNPIISLLMCSGSKFSLSPTLYDHLDNEYFNSIIKNYKQLSNQLNPLNETKSKTIKNYKDKNTEELKTKLKSTMIELTEENSKDNKNKINLIANSLISTPLCLINIIHDYEYESLVKFIDWK